jgi:hypothetical protein
VCKNPSNPNLLPVHKCAAVACFFSIYTSIIIKQTLFQYYYYYIIIVDQYFPTCEVSSGDFVHIADTPTLLIATSRTPIVYIIYNVRVYEIIYIKKKNRNDNLHIIIYVHICAWNYGLDARRSYQLQKSAPLSDF